MADETKYVTKVDGNDIYALKSYQLCDSEHSFKASDFLALKNSFDAFSLSDYYTKEQTSSLVNGVYNDVYTQKQIDAKLGALPDFAQYVTVSALTDRLSGYARKTDIPDISGLASKASLEAYQPLLGSSTAATVKSLTVGLQTLSAGSDGSLRLDGNVMVTENMLPDLSGYALVTQIPDVSGLASKASLASYLAKADAQTLYQPKGSYLTEHQSLAGYAKTADVPVRVSQLTNDLGYLSAVPSEYITGAELSAFHYITLADVPATDLSGYYTKKETDSAIKASVPDLSGYATLVALETVGASVPSKLSQLANDAQYVNASNMGTLLSSYCTKEFLASSLSGYVTVSALASKGYITLADVPAADLSDYYTKEGTQSAIQASLYAYTPDLSAYATDVQLEAVQASIPGRLSQLTNDAQFVNVSNKARLLSDYYTSKQVDELFDEYTPNLSDYVKKGDLAVIKLSGKYELSDLPDLYNDLSDGMYSVYVNSQGYELVMIDKSTQSLTRMVPNGKVYSYTFSTGVWTQVSGNGGGGGGGATSVVLTTVTDPSFSAALNGTAEIVFDWSSDANGNGYYYLYVGDVQVALNAIPQGRTTVDISKYLTLATTYTVRVVVYDSNDSKNSLIYSVTAVNLRIASTFDDSAFYTGSIDFRYTPYGDVDKTVHISVDGVDHTEETSDTGVEKSYTVPVLSHGVHALKVWETAVIGGSELSSGILSYQVIAYVPGNSTPILSSPFADETIQDGDALTVPYIAFTATSITTPVVLSINGQTSSLTVDRTKQYWTTKAYAVGSNTLSITAGTTALAWTVTVKKTDIDIQPVTGGLGLFLSSFGRTNSESSKDSWTYTDSSGSVVNTALTGFNWISNGWVADSDGNTALKASGSARGDIAYKPFSGDAKVHGKTLEIEFMTSDVVDYTATVLSAMAGGIGITITPTEFIFRSALQTVTGQFKTNERTRLTLVIEPSSADKFIYVYLNGIISGLAVYSASDSFQQNDAADITFGSSSAAVSIYRIRCYDTALTPINVVDNYIYDMDSGSARTSAYARNQIYDESETVLYSKVKGIMPTVTLTALSLPSAKGEKRSGSVVFEDCDDSTLDFSFDTVTISPQGTSSLQYPYKNFKLKFPSDANIRLYSGAVGENVLTLKADYASSAGVYNAGNAMIVNGLYQEKNPAQEKDSACRNALYGIPVAVFYRKTASATPSFYYKGSLNLDKTSNALGYADGDESWSDENNTSPLCNFNSIDFSTISTDFEPRYPDSDTPSYTKLEALISWIYSCKGDSAKFKSEVSSHFNLYYLEMYYIYGMVMGGIDSFTKNMYLTYFADTGLWYPQFYDLDSSFGIDNTGRLTFGYNIEFQDTIDNNYCFNGHNNVLWQLTEDAFSSEIQSMYQSLRNDGILTYDYMMGILYGKGISKYPEGIYNEDTEIKYVGPYLLDGTDYLSTALGSTLDHLKYWVSNRLDYLDSKWLASDYASDSDRISLRLTTPTGVTPDYTLSLTAMTDMYMQIQYGSYNVRKRSYANQSTLIDPTGIIPSSTVFNDTETYIYGSKKLTALGDISKWYPTLLVLSAAPNLTYVKVGDDSSTYANANLQTLTVGNNRVLQTLDISNCTSLAGSLDLSACVNLSVFKAGGTKLTSVDFSDGGELTSVVMPSTISALALKGQTHISSFTYPGTLSTIWIEGCGAAGNSSAAGGLSSLSLVQSAKTAGTLQRIRLTDVDWTLSDLTLLEYLKTDVKGIDDSGLNTDKSVLAGKIYLDSDTAFYSDELAAYAEYWGSSLVITAKNETFRYTCVFKNYDGTVLQTTEKVVKGTTVEYTGATPTKPYDESLRMEYSFSGWDHPLTDISADTTFTAQFREIPHYIATFVNYDGTVLQTSEVVSGNSASYTGTTPTKPYDESLHMEYSFSGWDKSLSGMTADTTFTAQYTEIPHWKVLFKNYDGTVLETDYVKSGTYASYGGTTPTKPNDDGAKTSYTFSAWSPAIASTVISSDTVFTATFTAVPYPVATFINYDNTVLYTVSVAPGGYAAYEGTTPTKADDVRGHDYSFSGWSPDISTTAMTADTTFTAQFTGTLNTFAVRFYNGTTLLETDAVVYDDAPVFSGASQEPSDKTKCFFGWSTTSGSADRTALSTYKVEAATDFYAIIKDFHGVRIGMNWATAPTSDIKLCISAKSNTHTRYIDWGDGSDIDTCACNNGNGGSSTSYYSYHLPTHSVSKYAAGTDYYITITIPDSEISGSLDDRTIGLGVSQYSIEHTLFDDDSTHLTSVKSVYLNEPVNSYKAFKGCTSLSSVYIGASTSSNGTDFQSTGMFSGCTGLASSGISMGSDGDLTSYNMFEYCTGLTDLSFITAGTVIDSYQFCNCTGFEASLTIPSVITTVGDYAFYGDSSITTLTIPDSVVSIGECSFVGCLGIATLNLGTGLKTVGYHAFYRDYSIMTVNITDVDRFAEIDAYDEDSFKLLYKYDSYLYLNGAKLTDVVLTTATKLGKYAFNQYRMLKSITVGDSVTSIGTYAVSNDADLTSVSIGKGVTSWGGSCFDYDDALTSLTLSEGLTTLSGFSLSTILASVVLPSTLTSIGDYTFNASSLTSVSLPAGLASLGKGFCVQDSHLESITVDSGNTHYKVADEALMTYDGTSLLLFPAKSAKTSFAVPSGCTAIREFAFRRASNLSTIALPSTITSIERDAFAYSGITSVELPGTAKLGEEIFEGCKSLTSAVLDSGITAIPQNTFARCTSLASVTLPETVTDMRGFGIFYGCTSLASIVLPSLPTELSSTFSECTSLTSVVLPSALKEFTYNEFNNCTSLKEITIPAAVTSMPNDTFSGVSLTTLTMLPSTPPSIGSSTFSTAPASIIVPSGSLSAYQSATNWSAYASNMKEAS